MSAGAAGAESRIRFPGSPEHTVGIELEVSLVDPETRELAPRAPEVLERLGDPRAKAELFQSIVELTTDVCATVPDARADLEARLRRLTQVCDELGIGLMCLGTHPTSRWAGLPITQDERYLRFLESMQWTARRLLITGLHVHVGVPSGEHAVALMNSLSAFVPHFLALSASSPFWLGYDTGLASSRVKVFENLPTAGLPPQVANWTEFATLMRTLRSAGAINSIREIWWDVRPHPGFGTIELRMCDGVNTLSEVAAIAAFAQTLVAYLSDLYEHGEELPFLRGWTLKENKWRAARSGEAAMLLKNERGDLIPLPEHTLEWIELLGPTAVKLGCASELEGVRRILEDGPSYRRQRRLHAETGSLLTVIDESMRELREDAPCRI